MTKTSDLHNSVNLNSVPGGRLVDATVGNAKIDGSSPISSGKISYTASQTGAEIRSLVDKLGDVKSVLDFIPESEHAAIKNGTSTTPVSTYIQTALNLGGIVFFPAGTYNVETTLVVGSNTVVYGEGTKTLVQIAAGVTGTKRCFATSSEIDNENIQIRDFRLYGNSQIGGDIFAGNRATGGVVINRAKNVYIDNLYISDMGIANPAGPGPADNGWGGYGITVSSRNGPCTNVRVNNCTVERIAGGGYVTGDGIYVEAFGPGGQVPELMDVVVSNCWVSTCGRHCYTVAGGTGEPIPVGVKFINCYGEKSALDWLDIEEGIDTLVQGCTMRNCGNDQTYFDPEAEYGPNFRLFAAIATGNNQNQSITIDNCTIRDCYFGITYGATEGLTITNTHVFNSTVYDIGVGLADGAERLTISDCTFNTGFTNYFVNAIGGGRSSTISNCTFAGRVQVGAGDKFLFNGCEFGQGVFLSSNGVKESVFSSCVFQDYPGNAMFHANNQGPQRVVVSDCIFKGAGQLVDGISFGYNGPKDWIVTGCQFVDLLGGGVRGGDDGFTRFNVSHNTFTNCVYGVYSSQSFSKSIVANNTFRDISDTCIGIDSVFASAGGVEDCIFTGNLAGGTCGTGIKVVVASGFYDYFIIQSNNLRACSTPLSLAGGNANGIVSDNIV